MMIAFPCLVMNLEQIYNCLKHSFLLQYSWWGAKSRLFRGVLLKLGIFILLVPIVYISTQPWSKVIVELARYNSVFAIMFIALVEIFIMAYGYNAIGFLV